MTAAKKKQQKSGGTLMNMRSGFKKAVGTGGKKKKGPKKKWTFLEVLYLVGGVALLFAVVWLMSKP
jgi:hypothetical protein